MSDSKLVKDIRVQVSKVSDQKISSINSHNNVPEHILLVKHAVCTTHEIAGLVQGGGYERCIDGVNGSSNGISTNAARS